MTGCKKLAFNARYGAVLLCVVALTVCCCAAQDTVKLTTETPVRITTPPPLPLHLHCPPHATVDADLMEKHSAASERAGGSFPVKGYTKACCTPAPPSKYACAGRVGTLAGLPTYFTGSPSATEAVIFVHDIYGIDPPLTKKLADKVAREGYLVVIPDFLRGDPWVPRGANRTEGIEEWAKYHLCVDAVPDVKKVVDALKEKGVRHFGLAGFCWGAKVAALTGKDKTFQALVQCHPSLIEPEDYEEVQVPIAALAAPQDRMDLYESILANRKDVDSFVKTYEGVFHGWINRYDENNPQEVAKAEEAHRDMLAWFAKYVPVTKSMVE